MGLLIAELVAFKLLIVMMYLIKLDIKNKVSSVLLIGFEFRTELKDE